MAELETELQNIRNELIRISNQVIRNQVILDTLVHERDRRESERQRVPVLLLGANSAAITAIGVIANMWIAKGP